MDGVTFFFFSSRARNVSWERLLSFDPLEIADTIKKKKRRGRVTGIQDLRDIHSQPEEMKRGNPSIPR